MLNHLTGEKASEMAITFPFFQDISIRLKPVLTNGKGYPSSQLQKGLILISNNQELVEEGVGFGVPVLKHGLDTIFAGDMELNWSNEEFDQEITVTFLMNLEERLTSRRFGTIKSRSLYQMKNYLADLYRRIPMSRGLLTSLSNMLRSSFGWQTTYEDAGCNYAVDVHYSVDSRSGTIMVTMDTTGTAMDGVTEVILMNEQGGHFFDTYSDSSGLLLQGKKIGSWEIVNSEKASFLCRAHRIAFTLQQISGARLYRGRELVGSRLAWSGFGYSLHPSKQSFSYPLRIERLL